MLWEVFTQQYPFSELYEDSRYVKQSGKDESGKEVLVIREMKVKQDIIENDLRPCSKFDEGIPDEITEIIKQCWNKLSKNRPQMKLVVEKLCFLLKKNFHLVQSQSLNDSSNQWESVSSVLSSHSASSQVTTNINNDTNHPHDEETSDGVKLNITKSVFVTGHVFSVLIVEGQRLFVGLSSGTVRVFSLPNLRVVSSLQCFSSQSRVKGFCFDSNNQTVWSVSDKGEICVIKTTGVSLKIKHEQKQHKGCFTDIVFVQSKQSSSCSYSEKHNDGKLKKSVVASSSYYCSSGFIFVANPETNCVVVFDSSRKPSQKDVLKTICDVDGACLFAINHLYETSSPQVVFVCGIGGKVFVIDCSTLSVVRCIETLGGELAKSRRCPEAMCVSSNLLWICPSGSSSVVEVFRLDGTFVSSLKGHSGCVKSLCSVSVVVPGSGSGNGDHPDSHVCEIVLSGGFDGCVMAWRVVECGGSNTTIKCESEISINRKSSVEGIVCGPVITQKISSQNCGVGCSDVAQNIQSFQLYCGMLRGEVVQLSLEVKEAVHDLSCSQLLISDFDKPSFPVGDAPLPVSSSLSPPPPDYDAPEPPCC